MKSRDNNMNPELTVMIPALNTGLRVEATVETLNSALDLAGRPTCEVLIVDDGSTDDTGAIADRVATRYLFVRVIHHEVNRGVGRSFRDIIRAATGEKLLIVPGDNDMSLETLTLLLRQLRTADLVMCFFMNREERGRLRNILSDLFAMLYMAAFDVYVQYVNGPCVYPVKELRQLELVSDRFSIVAEVNVKLLRQGLTYVEVPGYRQTNSEGSNALSMGSLGETISVFLRLLWEIHVRQRHLFSKRPRRMKGTAELTANRSEATRNTANL